MNQLKVSEVFKRKMIEKAAWKAREKADQPQFALRGHHMLCMQMFRGEGYSDGFSQGMTAVIGRIRSNPSSRVRLVRRPDEICANCPNLTGQDQCSLSNRDVVKKDQGVFKTLGLKEDENGEICISYREALGLLRQNMTEEAFTEICGTCRWQKAGLCSWAFLKECLENNKMG